MEKKYTLFIPEKHNQDVFLLDFDRRDLEWLECVVNIYYAPPEKVSDLNCVSMSGAEVTLCDDEIIFCVKLKVYRKYYFPKFSEDLQWYHKEDYSDDIGAIAQAIEYARGKAVDMIGGPL